MDLTKIESDLPIETGRFYVCGPTAFMAYIRGQLLGLGVSASQMVYEVFGPHKDL